MPAVTPYTTPDEAWTFEPAPGSMYAVAQGWALTQLGRGDGQPLLVVGSPPAEVALLRDVAWAVTWLDWRPAPFVADVGRVQGDACALPGDWTGAFAAASSTCVWCHVGLGRYGDPVQPDGEAAFLREVRRVVRPGGRFVAMVGPMGDQAHLVGTRHRVTTLGHALSEAELAGWALERWTTWEEPGSHDVYLGLALR